MNFTFSALNYKFVEGTLKMVAKPCEDLFFIVVAQSIQSHLYGERTIHSIWDKSFCLVFRKLLYCIFESGLAFRLSHIYSKFESNLILYFQP